MVSSGSGSTGICTGSVLDHSATSNLVCPPLYPSLSRCALNSASREAHVGFKQLRLGPANPAEPLFPASVDNTNALDALECGYINVVVVKHQAVMEVLAMQAKQGSV